MDEETRKSPRKRFKHTPLPPRLQSLFHSIPETPKLPKKMELLHSNPNIYRIMNFLTDSEVEYFNKICTLHAKKFESSFMEDSENLRVISEVNSSLGYLYILTYSSYI
jgi:hypothetical protein